METQISTSQGQTGKIEEVEIPQQLGTGNISQFVNPSQPVTGQFTIVEESNEEKIHDDNYAERFIEELESQEKLRATEETAKIKLKVMNVCEHYFTNGLVTGTDTLDAINHAFRHIENIVIEELFNNSTESNFPKLVQDTKIVQEFFNKSKIIVQTYVEYLRKVRGIPKYTLKAFLANYTLTFEGQFNGMSENNISTYSFLNTFMPHLINVVKDKKDLKSFTERLINLIYFMKKNENISFVDLCDTTEYLEFIREFIDEYLDCNEDFLLDLLKKLHTNIVAKGSVFSSDKLENTFKLIRSINEMELMGHDTDYFVNKIVRTVRLKLLPRSIGYIFDNGSEIIYRLKRDIRDSHIDSRHNMNGNVQIADDAIDDRLALSEVPTNYFQKFSADVYSYLDKLPTKAKYNSNLPSFLLRQIFAENENIEINNPQEVINYFFTILDSAMLKIEDEVYMETGKTLPKNILYYFVILWRQEFAYHFERIARMQNPRKIDKLDFYLLKLMGKTEEEIERYRMFFVDENDTKPERSVDETFDVDKVIQEYVANFQKKLAAKYALKDVDYENTDKRLSYKQYALEVFSTFVRSEVTQDEIYYADNISEIIEDIGEEKMNNPVILIGLVHHVMRTIAGASKFIEIRHGEIINTLDHKLMTDVLVSMINKNKYLQMIFERAFRVREPYTLAYFIESYLKNPHSVLILERVTIAEA